MVYSDNESKMNEVNKNSKSYKWFLKLKISKRIRFFQLV